MNQKIVPGGFTAWLIVTLLFTLIPYFWVLYSDPPDATQVVQDDARHYVVWFRQAIDPDLYPNDYIADFWSAVTPWLYRALYWPFTQLGIDPIQTHLYILMPLTGLLLAGASYIFIYHFWPSAVGSSMAALVLINLLGWRNGLPHDFAYTSVLLITLAFVTRRVVATAAAMFAATGLIPVAGLISGAATGLMMLSRRAPFLSRNKRDWVLVMAMGAAFLCGAYLATSATQSTGPTLSAAEVPNIPFMGPDGFRPYRGKTLLSTYVCNENTGIAPFCGEEGLDTLSILDGASDEKILLWSIFVAATIGISLWLLRAGFVRRWLSANGLPHIDEKMVKVWTAWIVAGSVLYVTAHLLAFQLHMPSRFSRYTITLTFSMILSITFAVVFLRVITIGFSPKPARQLVVFGLFAVAAVGLSWISITQYADGMALRWTKAPRVETYLRETPKDTLVAGIHSEIDNVPSFGYRSVLSSLEYIIPQKRIFFNQMAARLTEFSIALYASDRSAFAELVSRYGIDYVLVERVPQNESVKLLQLAASFPAVLETAEAIKGGREPFFRSHLDDCVRAEQRNLVLADAECLAKGQE